MRLIFTLIIFSVALCVNGQSNIQDYLRYDFLPQDDFEHYRDVRIDWNFDGKLQSMVNAGITELKEENFSRALGHLDEAVATAPEFWIALYYRGITNKILGNLEPASNDLLLANIKSGGKSEIYIELGEIYQSQEKFDQALRCYDKARDLSPKEVDGYFGIANVSFLNRDVEKAIRFYKKCNEINPKFPDAYVKTALLKLFVNNREKQAMTYFDMALEADPSFEQGLFWRGLMNIEFHNVDQALQDWTQLIKLKPENPYFHMLRGFLLIEKADYEQAFTDLKNGVLKSETSETNFKLFGSLAVNKKIDVQTASRYLVRNVYGLDDSVAAPLKKGFCFLLVGRYRESISALYQSIKAQPTASAYLLKSLAHEYNNEPNMAIECYDKTLALDNSLFDVHKKRAIYRSKQKDYRGAALDFLAMQKLEPENIVTYKLRGLLTNSQGDYYGVISDFSKYLKVDSLDEEIIELRANAWLNIGEFKFAQQDYEKLVKLRPATARFQEHVYIALLLQKDTTAAWEALDKFEAVFPDYPLAYLQKMEIHIARREWVNALAVFNKLDMRWSVSSQIRSEALFLKGIVHLQQGAQELALEAFSDSIRTGNSVNFTNLDALFSRGKLYWNTGKKKKAIDDFEALKAHGYLLHTEFINQVLNSKP